MLTKEAADKADKRIKAMTERQLRALITEVHETLNGTEWDSDTMSIVASHLISAGLPIADPYDQP